MIGIKSRPHERAQAARRPDAPRVAGRRGSPGLQPGRHRRHRLCQPLAPGEEGERDRQDHDHKAVDLKPQQNDLDMLYEEKAIAIHLNINDKFVRLDDIK